MIEETATVVRVEGDIAWLETMRNNACGSCAANKGCGTSVLAGVLGKKATQVRALNRVQARAGDRVVVGIEDRMLVRGSLAVYAVPILALLLGAVAGDMLGKLYAVPGETLSILLGVAGLGAGFWWLRYYARRVGRDAYYQPVVLRRIP